MQYNNRYFGIGARHLQSVMRRRSTDHYVIGGSWSANWMIERISNFETRSLILDCDAPQGLLPYCRYSFPADAYSRQLPSLQPGTIQFSLLQHGVADVLALLRMRARRARSVTESPWTLSYRYTPPSYNLAVGHAHWAIQNAEAIASFIKLLMDVCMYNQFHAGISSHF